MCIRDRVESACKQFRARLAGSGMRWSRPGLQRLRPIRTVVMSQRFDDLGQKAYNLPRNRNAPMVAERKSEA